AIVRDEDGFAGIDPSMIELMLDGAPLAHRFLPGSDRVQAALPYDIANAEHELTLRARNLNGNSTKVARRDLLVDLPVDEGGTYGLRDRGGHFVLGFPDARGFPIRDQVLRMRGGDLEFPIQGGGVDVHFYDERLGTDPMYALVGIDTFAIRLDELPLYSGVSVVRPFEPLWAGDSIAAFADAFGLVGYDVAARRLFDRPDASPGAPHVVIDPDRRPSQSGPCARSSVSFVSKQTKALLDWYGPGAALSHSEREAPHPAVRVRAAGEYDARLWITFREADSYSVTHFPGSRLGGPAAKAIADKMTDRLGVTVPVRTDTEPVLRDTPCPALVVRFPQEEDCDISASTRLHALAQAVSEGVALAGTRNGSEFWESIHFKEYRLPDLEAGDLVYFELAGITLQVREKGDFLLLAPRPPEIIGSARIRSAGKWFSYREKYEGTAPEPRLEP
ncbi:MAG: hypothetical protein HKN20_05385, partial [Gemmatimonadetes bacterium]|nr:hypothetical protein [Gemmatimonadota bacterium]